VIKYEETEEGMLITRCMTDSETLFVLDFTFDGRKIIGIEKNALNLCTDLKLLVLGENILSISEDAIKDWSAIRIQAVPGTYAWNFAAEKNILAEDAESFKSEGESAVEEGEQTVLSEENENAAQYDEPLE